ncbi:hypothetical protein [Streptomyces gardneri]|nr:hypothetical protein [Streptomyces gardneri]
MLVFLVVHVQAAGEGVEVRKTPPLGVAQAPTCTTCRAGRG